MNFIKPFVFFSVSLLLLGCQTKQPESKDLNFLFILVDDLGYSDLSATGSTFYETPNVDAIASKGLEFTNGYANCAVCSPSRASLMTGQYPTEHGITDWIGAKSGEDWRTVNRHTRLLPAEYVHQLPKDVVTLPEALKSNGYKTFFAGKWHLGSAEDKSLPTDHGFDINQGGYHRGGPYTGGYFSPFNNPYMEDSEDEKGMSLSMKLAKETSSFITQNKDEKFLAYLSFYAVHGPIQTTEEKWNKYRDKAEKQGIEEQGFEMERVLPKRKKQDNPVYGGLIEQMDEAVGAVLDKLEELNLSENTVVIFTSDNGGVASGDNYSTNSIPFRGGKGYQWEGGIRVPYFIYVPGMKKGNLKNNTPVSGMDLYPTILDLAGITAVPKNQFDGTSLTPLLSGEKIADRPLFWHYPHYGNQGGEPHSIIREGQWKLIHYWEDGRQELFNLEEDINELKNMATNNSKLVNSLNFKLMNWLKTTNANIPLKDATYDPVASEKVLNNYKEILWPRLEKQRTEMLKPDWKPNDDWWGSASKNE